MMQLPAIRRAHRARLAKGNPADAERVRLEEARAEIVRRLRHMAKYTKDLHAAGKPFPLYDYIEILLSNAKQIEEGKSYGADE